MKPSLPIAHSPSSFLRRQRRVCEPGLHHSSFFLHNSAASGVALVVTLIMLSVITFMAISFLVLSRAEHGSVATETDQAQARFAADTALQRAIAQSLAPILAQTNEFWYDLLVSTNYISPFGFTNNVSSPLNVNYDFDSATHGPLTVAEQRQNLANLWFDPRPPVFITNRFSALGGYEFRYFVNLNRNVNAIGPIFDPTGWLAVTNLGVATGATNFYTGDPQWIGILDSPDRPHAADNRFTARFAYLVIPAGKTLDFNCLHDYAKGTSPTMVWNSGDGFLRNQGVGSWEGNLASFLVDLNTNVWPPPLVPPNAPPPPSGAPYTYTLTNGPNSGTAFDDSFALLRYRYQSSISSLFTVQQLYGALGQSAFANDYIDGYSAGPLMGVSWPPIANFDPDASRTATVPWSGAYNTNHFFTPQDFFDKNKTAMGFPATVPPPVTFTDRLLGAGNDTTSSYNEYTFYRMLASLGSDTAGDGNRINLNYCNLDNFGNVVPNMATNFIPWQPLQFFTNTANALLHAYGYNFTVTNIQIYPTNFYTPNVHRLLQVAANIYDASTNRFGLYNYPTVFRPLIRTFNGMVFIAGYREATDAQAANLNVGVGVGTVPPKVILGFTNTYSVLRPYGTGDLGAGNEPQVVGIPFIIGAKVGFPNFNEFSMQLQGTASRKVQFRRALGSTDGNIVETNQMYLLTITNTIGLEAWNSYAATFPANHPLQVQVDGLMLAVITNELGTILLSNAVPYRPVLPNISGWRGFTDLTPSSFRAVTNISLVLSNSTYSDALKAFMRETGNFEQGQGFPLPHWYISIRPMLRFSLVDTSTARIIDYVSLDAPTVPVDMVTLMAADVTCGNYYTPDPSRGAMWCTNRYGPGLFSPTFGIMNQIDVALGQHPAQQWPSTAHEADVDFFRTQFGLSPLYYPVGTFSKTNTFQSPYSPSRQISFYTSWQANDPLVHYTPADLTDTLAGRTNSLGPGMSYELDTTAASSLSDLGGLDMFTGFPVGAQAPLNPHYRPWGGNPSRVTETAPATNWRLEMKDPLVTRSDYWAFPTNKYPNIGWLGRVHRGTPWQTIYLKSTTNNPPVWIQWSGNGVLVTNVGQISTGVMPRYFPTNAFIGGLQAGITYDAFFSMPENDRVLLDLFTTSINDNAARGRMSVNQQNLAGWSAILGGVISLTNATPDALLARYQTQPGRTPAIVNANTFPAVVEPAGAYPANAPSPLARLVNGINNTRATYFPSHEFTHLGDILATPELTVASPFLNTGGTVNSQIRGDTNRWTYQQTLGITDAAYERIPQQILGLLQCDHTPRFVIYAYGQALKPAPRSIITSGPFFGLCTNYQISAEVQTRAVVRIDGAPTHPHAVVESFNVLPPD